MSMVNEGVRAGKSNIDEVDDEADTLVFVRVKTLPKAPAVIHFAPAYSSFLPVSSFLSTTE